MSFTTKDWKAAPDASTPVSATALEDMETRLAAYTDQRDAVSLGRYRLLVPWRSIVIPTATAAATLFLPEGSSSGIAAATTNSPLAVVYIDPADYAVAGLTTTFRLRAVCLTDAVAPAVTFTAGLYPVSAVAGGVDAITMTAGTVQTGSTAAFASPAASTRSVADSGDFTAPVAGYYALGVAISGTTATGSREVLSVCVQVRNA